MVTDLMRQHIGLGKVAAGAVFVLEILKETKVHIHPLILRAVERPHASTRRPAATCGRAAVEYQRRGGIASAGLGEDGRPDSLCVRQHRLDEGCLLIIGLFINHAVTLATRKGG
jgi:hypothetical protein